MGNGSSGGGGSSGSLGGGGGAAAAATSLNPQQFAGALKNAIEGITPSFGPNKVFIHEAYEKFSKTPAGRGITREQFNQKLVEAHQQGSLSLSRADLIGAMKASDVQKALTQGPGTSEFHFIRLDKF